MNNTPDWYISERTRVMAVVHLTRRDDLVISKADPDVGPDLLVRIVKPGERPVRQFGVFLHGALKPLPEARLNAALQPALGSFERLGPFPYPACLFYFTMQDNEGYYTWVAEPAVEDGLPQLLMRQASHGRRLDRAALDDLVGRVDAWYDAFFAQIAVKAP